MSTRTILIIVGLALLIVVAVASLRRKPKPRGVGGLKVVRGEPLKKK